MIILNEGYNNMNATCSRNKMLTGSVCYLFGFKHKLERTCGQISKKCQLQFICHKNHQKILLNRRSEKFDKITLFFKTLLWLRDLASTRLIQYTKETVKVCISKCTQIMHTESNSFSHTHPNTQ